MIQGIKVFDFHCHFPNSGSWFPDYTGQDVHDQDDEDKRQAELWRKAYNFPEHRVVIEDDREAADSWYQDMVKKEIDLAVFVSGGGNERLAGIVAHHPDRFVGFAHHHPLAKDAPDQLEKALTELGHKGYKILGPAVSRPISDPSLFPLWEICQAHDVPVLIHFGILDGAVGLAGAININPLALQDAAKAFPNVKFVLPHFGAGYPTELLHLCWVCPNVLVDTSGSNQWVRWMAYDLNLEQLFKKFYQTIGPERIIFATDSSWFPRTFAYSYLEEQHRIMRFLGWPQADIELILWKNTARLLKLI